jgi:hypothetical protein
MTLVICKSLKPIYPAVAFPFLRKEPDRFYSLLAQIIFRSLPRQAPRNLILKLEDIMFRRRSLLHATFCGLLHKMVGDDLKSVLINVRQITQAASIFQDISSKRQGRTVGQWGDGRMHRTGTYFDGLQVRQGSETGVATCTDLDGHAFTFPSIAGKSVLECSRVRVPPASCTCMASMPPFSTFHYLAPSLRSRPKGDNHHIMGCVYDWHTRQNRL